MIARNFKNWFLRKIDERKRKRKIKGHIRELEVHRKLTKSQKKEVQDFYMSLIGKKVSLLSHEYFYSRTGVFSKDYVPVDLYYSNLLPKANKASVVQAYRDKNMFDIIFSGENLPHTYLKNRNGYYYFEGRPVSESEAIQLCQNLGQVIIKPTWSGKGHGIQLVDIKDGSVKSMGKPLIQLLKDYKKNFIIQACIRQHERMSALNPTSVNTIRILSYRSGMEVLIIYAVVRIGHLGSVVDNQSAGGISTTIDKDGRLGKYSFGGYNKDKIEKTDTGIVLDGYQLPSYDKTIEIVKRMHFNLPYFDIVGWDIAIDENGIPVLIEFNLGPGLSQSAFCSGMGEHTERIIRELWPRQNSKYPIR